MVGIYLYKIVYKISFIVYKIEHCVWGDGYNGETNHHWAMSKN